ncbi:MAG: lipoprotein-releasing system ATP-binding protein LolD, partial [Elusimicrobiota bacterium]
RQRVAIARALINNPGVILADEPTGNLDRRNGELVFNILKELTETFDVAVVAVTHNEHAALHASRTIHISDGRIVKTPTP